MRCTFDPAKDASNTAKHGVSPALTGQFEWDSAVTWADMRRTCGEPRQCALGHIGQRLHFMAFVDREGQRRIISLRKANMREEKFYAQT